MPVAASRRADRAAGLRGARRRGVLAAAARLLRDGARHGRAGVKPGPRAVGADAAAPARAAIRDALMSPAMFSGWGIRTLAADEPLYDPLSYHRGSVWPHDTALCAAGLRRHGFDDDFLALFDALVDAAAAAPGAAPARAVRRPARVAGEPFVPYPVACRPQAWAAGAIPFLLAEGLARAAPAAAARRRRAARRRDSARDAVGGRRRAGHVGPPRRVWRVTRLVRGRGTYSPECGE